MSLYSRYSIFLLSILASLFVLTVERLAGIGWDFHPDASTYITLSSGTASNFNFSSLLESHFSSFYVLVDLLGSQVWLVITLNIFFYAATNVALMSFFRKHIGPYKKQVGILFFLIVFNPYRTHLSVHVLKDTLIIFGMVYFFTSSRIYSWLFLLLSYSVSIRTIIYLVSVFNKRNLIFITIPIIFFLLMQSEGFLHSILSTENQVDMTFREFDKVPNFFEFGIFGAIARAIIWPFLYLTGIFVLLSPTIMYLPIAISSFFLQFWHMKQYGGMALYFQVYLAMAILAFMVSGFTSFIRYSLPLVTILPILVIKNNTTHYEK